jgi:hypothetical protein
MRHGAAWRASTGASAARGGAMAIPQCGSPAVAVARDVSRRKGKGEQFPLADTRAWRDIGRREGQRSGLDWAAVLGYLVGRWWVARREVKVGRPG